MCLDVGLDVVFTIKIRGYIPPCLVILNTKTAKIEGYRGGVWHEKAPKSMPRQWYNIDEQQGVTIRQ